MTNPLILPAGPHGPLHRVISAALKAAGDWIGFDEFMALALYAPGLGYYTGDSPKFGLMPANHENSGGSDFATAPEMSSQFGRALARQVAQALKETGTREVWEFGAGTGALAQQLLDRLDELDRAVERYTIVDLSGSLRERQRLRLGVRADKVRWLSELPEKFSGVVIGNEVLDAMPVKLLARARGIWHERGVALHEDRLAWADRPTDLRPPVVIKGEQDYLTEIHLQAEGFIRTLADRLERGAAFFIDYGFPEHEYYHPQRSMGTVMCHRAHRMDAEPLLDVGSKDITAHVNFTGIALAGQEAGLSVAGYTSQGRFLLNCGLLDGLEGASLPDRVMVQRLVNEHEMGELFKVIGFVAGREQAADWQPMGFAEGDRMYTL